MANSENGWPLVSTEQLESLPWLPNNARLLAGSVAQVLGYVARQFEDRVEHITSTSSFRDHARIGNGNTYSNHASGTALDLNGGQHPQGKKGTFTSAQVVAIRQILAECSGVLRWGGDYVMPITDEMHFEIRPGVTAQQVASAAIFINKQPAKIPPAVKKGVTHMQCVYWRPNNAGTEGAYYFNGVSSKPIPNPDTLTLLRNIYRDNNQKEIPEYHWVNAAPWWIRLESVCVKQ